MLTHGLPKIKYKSVKINYSNSRIYAGLCNTLFIDSLKKNQSETSCNENNSENLKRTRYYDVCYVFFFFGSF